MVKILVPDSKIRGTFVTTAGRDWGVGEIGERD